jgi:hypothetical protein
MIHNENGGGAQTVKIGRTVPLTLMRDKKMIARPKVNAPRVEMN